MKQIKITNGNIGQNVIDKQYEQIGIRMPEGTEFSVNEGPSIIIGSTGVYEINLVNTNSVISSLIFTGFPEGFVEGYVDLVEKGYEGSLYGNVINPPKSIQKINEIDAEFHNEIKLISGNGINIETNNNEIEIVNNYPVGKISEGKYGEVFNNYNKNKAIGDYSHAEGNNNTALGPFAHAEGYSNTASASSTHVEGCYNQATEKAGYSHVEGSYNIAKAQNTHVEGRETIASSDCQHVSGKANIEDETGKYACIVGNGTTATRDDKGNITEEAKRSNAHTLDWSGNAWYQGLVQAAGFIDADGKPVGGITEITEDTFMADLEPGMYKINAIDDSYGLWLDDAYWWCLYEGVINIAYSEYDNIYTWTFVGRDNMAGSTMTTGKTTWNEDEYWYCEEFLDLYNTVESNYNKVNDLDSPDYITYPSTKAVYEEISKEKSRANNDLSNAIKGIASGSVVRIDDVSPIEHTVKINLQGETTTVYRYGKNLFSVNEHKVKSTQPWGANRVGDIDIRPGKYVASCNFKQIGTDKSAVALSIRNKDEVTQIIKTVKSTDVEGSLICPFDVSEDINGVSVFLYSNTTADTLSTECDFTYIQIEVGESATDFEVYKGKETYTPDENGNVTVNSISPTMTLTTNDSMTINCEYNKDINKYINQNTQSIDILTVVNTTEEHTNEQVYGALALDESLSTLGEELEKKQDKIKNKVFEQIATVIVEPDADGNLPERIVINKDDNGNTFQLTDIYCNVIIGMTAGKSGRFYIQAGNPIGNKMLALWGNGNIDLRDGALRKWCFRYDSYGENNGGLMAAPSASLALTADYPSANVSNLLGQPIPVGKTLDITEVRFIGQVGNPLTFMEGTTITLWGVRK